MVAGIGTWRKHESVLWTDHSPTAYWRRGQGTALVLLPGLCGGAGLVEPFAEILAERFDVIVPEYPGELDWFGVHRERLNDFVSWLDAVMAGFGLERPLLAGVSFGGALALEYAVRGRPLASLWVQGASSRFRSALLGDVAQAVLGRFPIAGDHPILKQMFRLLAGPARPDRRTLRFILEQCWTTDQLVTAARIRALNGYDVHSRLDRIRCPVTVAVGEEDLLVRSADAAELADAIPRAKFASIAEAGHLAFVTHPQQLALAFSATAQPADAATPR